MKHIKPFNEELDYLGRLKQQKDLDREYDASKEKEDNERRSKLTGKELSKLKTDGKKQRSFEERESERKDIVQVVVDSLIYSNLGKSGFENFEDDIKMFLSKYPLEKLPSFGSDINWDRKK